VSMCDHACSRKRHELKAQLGDEMDMVDETVEGREAAFMEDE